MHVLCLYPRILQYVCNRVSVCAHVRLHVCVQCMCECVCVHVCVFNDDRLYKK